MILCWSSKGGSGTTVVAASVAILSSARRPTTLIDLTGDLPAVLGLAEPSGPGVTDWLSSAHAPSLSTLAVPVTEQLQLVPRGTGAAPSGQQWSALAAEIAGSVDELVVIDAGVGAPDRSLHTIADRSILVVRPCYLALRRAVHVGLTPTEVVLVSEPGRALTARDVERAIGAPVTADIPLDPAVARAVDAGLLVARLPRSLAHALRTPA